MKLKSTLLLFSALLVSGLAFSQGSIEPLSPPVLMYGDANSALIQASFGVKNNNGSTLPIKVERFVISEVPGTKNNMCWGINCYSESTSITPNYIDIESGAIEYSFKGDYQPQGQSGTTTIKYCFFDDSNPGDVSCVTIDFQTGVTSIKEEAPKPQFDIHPNPARSLVNLSHNLVLTEGARLVMRDMIGKTVKEIVLDPSHTVLIFQVDDLKPGVYFYTIHQDGQALQSKRLVVTR